MCTLHIWNKQAVRKTKPVLSLRCYWRDRTNIKVNHGEGKIVWDPGCLTKNPSHFSRIKNGAHGITRILLRTCSNMPFLPQKLSTFNYFGLIILLLFLHFSQGKNCLVQKESTIESKMFRSSEVETERNILTRSVLRNKWTYKIVYLKVHQ